MLCGFWFAICLGLSCCVLFGFRFWRCVSFLLLVGGFLELLSCQFSCVWCGGCLVGGFVGIAVVLGVF